MAIYLDRIKQRDPAFETDKTVTLLGRDQTRMKWQLLWLLSPSFCSCTLTSLMQTMCQLLMQFVNIESMRSKSHSNGQTIE